MSVTTLTPVRVWAHLHLPKLQAFRTTREDAAVISVKVPGERIAYTAELHMTDVEFKVSEPGRQRCINENVRNVHAWVIGTPIAERREGELRKALYDPWKGGSFVDADTLEPVRTASYAYMIEHHVYYIP